MVLKEVLNTYRGLPRSIYVIFIARIINSVGSFVFPFLTTFLTQDLGLQEGEAGFFVMLATTAFAPGSLIGGKLCDHIGRKKVLVIFQGLAAAVLVPCAFLQPSKLIAWLLILFGMFNGGAFTASTAMAADLTTRENRKQAFSLLYLGHNIGFAVGPMIAGFLYRNYFSWIFIGDALTTVLSLALIIPMISETLPSKEEMEKKSLHLNDGERAEDCGLFTALLRRPLLLIFAGVVVVYNFVYSQTYFSLQIQVNELFGFSGPRSYGILMSVNALTVVTMTALVTHKTARLKPVICLSLGSMFFVVGLGMVYYISQLYLFMISTFIWTIGEIFFATNVDVYINNNTPVSHRGRFNSVIQIIAGSGSALGPLLTGKYIQHFGVKKVWVLAPLLALGVTFMMLCLYLVEKVKEENQSNGRFQGITIKE